MSNTKLNSFPDIVYQKLLSPETHPVFNYNGFKPGKTILKKGHVKEPGHRAFPIDIIYDRDVAITVRDGAKLYADVFRSVDSESEKVPVIIPWSPYGKSGTGMSFFILLGLVGLGVGF